MLFIADEIQSGLGRTGKTFACEHEGVVPDMYMLGKALGGGIVPVSAVVGNRDVLGVLQPGEHGSTFGGNPLACAVGRAVVALLDTGEFQQRATELGAVAARPARGAASGAASSSVRARGLWAGVDIDPALTTGREVCERLAGRGRPGQGHPRLDHPAGPAAGDRASDLDWAVDQLGAVLSELQPTR